jgi:hypothetical protein
MEKKIAIGIACHDSVKPKTLLSLMNLVAQTKYQIVPIVQEGCHVEENREKIVRKAQNEGCDYLLFIDSDMVFEPDLLDRLMAHNKDIVGVDSKFKLLPLQSTVLYEGEMPKELFKCEAVGTGIMLINMNVFLKFQPWFYLEITEYGSLKFSSDYVFCRNATKNGVEVYCDPTIYVGHLGEYNYKNI